MDRSLDDVGVSDILKQSIFETLAGILHLCNLEFEENSLQHAQILNIDSLNQAARLLKLDFSELLDALTTKQFKTRLETVA